MKIQNFAGFALLMGTLMNVPAEAGYGRVAGTAAPLVVAPEVRVVAGGAPVVNPAVPAGAGVVTGGMQDVRPGFPAAGGALGALGLDAINPHDVANRHFESAVKVPTVQGCDPNFPPCPPQ